MRVLVVTLALAAAVAGCVQAPSALDAASLPPAPLFAFADDAAEPARALAWTGLKLVAKNEGPNPYVRYGPVCAPPDACEPTPCGQSDCETTRVRLDVPAGWSGSVQFRAQSARNYTVGPLVRVLDSTGALVAEGKMTDWMSIAVVEDPAAGEYDVEVVALYGAGAYEAAVVTWSPADASADPARDLLPNLRTIAPADVAVATPGEFMIGAPAALPASRGCRADETTEQRALRCLRFSNGIANVGEGALEVRLDRPSAAAAFAGASRFVQRVYASDGTFRDEPAGPAAFHATHGHFHYNGLATYTLHAYDVETGARGEQVAEGRKAGFCFYDTAMPDLTRADVGPQGFDGSGCLPLDDPATADAFSTGLSPGFTDFYGWYLPDQYIEITGLADGVYELVTVADGADTLIESDESDNEATAVIRLAGDDVVVLATTGV